MAPGPGAGGGRKRRRARPSLSPAGDPGSRGHPYLRQGANGPVGAPRRGLLDRPAWSTPVYMHTLGCPKNRVDSEVIARDPLRGRLPARPGPGPRRRHRGEHLRLHRQRQGGVGPGHRRAGPDEGRGPLQEAGGGRLPGAALPGAAGPRAAGGGPLRGTGAYQEIARIVGEAQARRIVVPDPDFVHDASNPARELASLPHRLPQDRRGLRQRLRLCIIPALRGPQRSRPVADLVAEASASRPRERWSCRWWPRTSPPTGRTFPGRCGSPICCRSSAASEGIRWIRLHYAYPRDFPDSLIEVMAREPKIVESTSTCRCSTRAIACSAP